MSPTSAEEVSRIIEKLKTGENSGLDNIPAEMLKNTSDVITAPLTQVFNSCYEESIFPDIFRTSMMKPSFKASDKQEVISYILEFKYCQISRETDTGKIDKLFQ